MSFILQTDSFIETGGCDGPRNNRSQPSREKTGVTMTEIQDKYIPEFELPYRNVDRYIKEVRNSWNRLDEGQRDSIRKSFRDMNLGYKVEGFANEEKNCDTLDSSLGYMYKDPLNIKKVLNGLWNPTNSQRAEHSIDEEKVRYMREVIYTWSTDNGFSLHTNYKSAGLGFLILFFALLFGFIIGIVVPR